jgi:hypothetical protein
LRSCISGSTAKAPCRDDIEFADGGDSESSFKFAVRGWGETKEFSSRNLILDCNLSICLT